MKNEAIKVQSRQTIINFEREDGTVFSLKLNFRDKRFVNRMLKLIQKWQRLGDTLDEELTKAESIEDAIDRLVAETDIECKVLTDFKADVESAFGAPIVDAMFGEGSMPSVEAYFDLFEAVTPYLAEAKKNEKAYIQRITQTYGIERLTASGTDENGDDAK